jgi:large subunit ribosomal protein L29
MKANEISELRKLDITELNDKIAKQKEELLNLRFQLALGQLDNTAQISKIKKSIAVMKTIITEKQNVK